MNSPVLHFYDFGAGVTAFSSTRRGGCSQGNYAEFNANLYCGDDPLAVASNRESLCKELGIPYMPSKTCYLQNESVLP